MTFSVKRVNSQTVAVSAERMSVGYLACCNGRKKKWCSRDAASRI